MATSGEDAGAGDGLFAQIVTPDSGLLILVMAFGFAVVWFRAAERFTEPSYTKRFSETDESGNNDNYYRLFTPRFTAVSRRFNIAKRTYTWFMATVYFLIALVPGANELITTAGNIQVNALIQAELRGPFIATMVLIGMHDLPVLNFFTSKVRERLYAYAKVPTNAREIALQLFGAPFDFSRYASSQGVLRQTEEFAHVELQDFNRRREDLETKWAVCACILHSLRTGKTTTTNPLTNGALKFDKDIFDEYSAEFNSLSQKFRRLAPSVNKYREMRTTKNNVDPDDSESIDTKSDVEQLLLRMATYLACAVLPKAQNDHEVIASLREIGFRLPPPIRYPSDIPMWLLGGGTFLILLIGAIWSTAVPWFESQVAPVNTLQHLHKLNYSLIPHKTGAAIIWGIASLVIHFCSAWFAITRFESMVVSQTWTGAMFERNWREYLKLGFYGGIIGYLLITAIALLMAYGTIEYSDSFVIPNDFSLPRYYGLTILVSLCWLPLPFVTAFAAVYHADTTKYAAGIRMFVRPIVIQSVTMAGLGWVLGYIYAEYRPFIGDGSPYEDSVISAFALYSAFLLAMIGGYLGALFAFRQRLMFKSRFVGSWQYTENQRSYMLRIDRFDEDKNITATCEWDNPDDQAHNMTITHGKCRPFDRGVIVEWEGENNEALKMPPLFLTFDEFPRSENMFIYTISKLPENGAAFTIPFKHTHPHQKAELR
tara:strand:- start:19053 stop:21188 length:2136 start_codon:yes stop_codon:yes gene_type:complete